MMMVVYVRHRHDDFNTLPFGEINKQMDVKSLCFVPGDPLCPDKMDMKKSVGKLTNMGFPGKLVVATYMYSCFFIVI